MSQIVKKAPPSVEQLKGWNVGRIQFLGRLLEIEKAGRVVFHVPITNSSVKPRFEATMTVAEAIQYCRDHDGERLFNEQVYWTSTTPEQLTPEEMLH
jgi:hypothetical protein